MVGDKEDGGEVMEGDGEGGGEAAVQEIPDSQRSATHRLRPAGNLLKEIRQHKVGSSQGTLWWCKVVP